MRHAGYVRAAAAMMFDELAPIHGLPPEMRLPLEMAALLHNAGKVIHSKGHHKHAEYLIRNAEMPGLSDETQALLACLVRYHGKSEPEPHHKLYASLPPRDRRRTRALSGILRIAVALDASNAQDVRGVSIRMSRKKVRLRLYLATGATVDMANLRRRAKPFEKEFGVRVTFTRTRAKLGASKAHRIQFASPQNKTQSGASRQVWGMTA
jgi:exopolyphosphatase/guanosine-5'-triphosphate,3'-diphosphate pyrophosphatase